MDNILHKETLIFSGTVEQSDNGDTTLTVTREDGMKKIWSFPASKVRLYRSLGGHFATAIRFMTGEDV